MTSAQVGVRPRIINLRNRLMGRQAENKGWKAGADANDKIWWRERADALGTHLD